MKEKSLFNLKMLKSNYTKIYVVLPELQNMSIELLSYCMEFLNSYQRLTFLCSCFEVSFYQLLLSKSKTFSEFKDNVEFDISYPSKLKEIQAKECVIIGLHDNQIITEPNKKAVFCLPGENSDIVFSESNNDVPNTKINYLVNLLAFLDIPTKKLLTGIDIAPSDIVKASTVTSILAEKQYYVIIVQSLIAAFKLSSFLKKNKLNSPNSALLN